jgi:HEPN domain-containing protein
VTSDDLAQSYLVKARLRLEALAFLRDRGGHSDVVREAQELVELALKGMLRAVGVDPPKFHDVGPILVEHRARFAPDVAHRMERAAEISNRLRRDRELAFYGDIDFIPTDQYSAGDAERAYTEAAWIVELAEAVISNRGKRK